MSGIQREPSELHLFEANEKGGINLLKEDIGHVALGTAIERQDIFDRIQDQPDSLEGLNFGRVQDFMSARKLRVAPFKVVDPDIYRTISGYFNDSESELGGAYSPNLDMAVVARNRRLEEANGIQYTEAMLVHELAHGSAVRRHSSLYIRNEEIGMKWGRSGFMVSGPNWPLRRKGVFLEEAFAELMAGEYLTEACGRLSGLIHEDELPNLRFKTDAATVKIAAKYAYYDPANQTGKSFVTPGIAATGLELLIEQRPELRQQMIDSRSGDPEAMRAVAKSINGISPGLYTRLSELQYSAADFAKGLEVIRSL